MAVSADPAVHAAVYDLDDGQDDDDNDDHDHHNNSSCYNSRTMRWRMQTGRHRPSGGRYRLGAGAIRSQYPRVVSIGGRRRAIGEHLD